MTRMPRDKQHPIPAASLSQMLEAAIHAEGSETPADDDDIARTSIRIPRAVLDEVSALAQANRMSVSLLVNLLLDIYLIGEGRPGYARLAPWYPDYALRKKSQAD
jgi:hypothetical protein